MLSVRLLVNSRLLVVTFWESQKLYASFLLHGGLASMLTPILFKDQLYMNTYECSEKKCGVFFLSLYRSGRMGVVAVAFYCFNLIMAVRMG